MGRRSAIQIFLKRLPLEKRAEATRLLHSAPSHRAAYQELKIRYKFRGSYDAVKHWRQNEVNLGVENMAIAAHEIAQDIPQVIRQASETSGRDSLDSLDPIEITVRLGKKLSLLCDNLTDLIRAHRWVKPDQVELNNQDAAKIIGALPSLVRASYSPLLDMHRLKGELEKKSLVLGALYEVSEDWRKTMEHENPELVGLLDGVLAVTRARLELDTPTVLEEVMQQDEAD